MSRLVWTPYFKRRFEISFPSTERHRKTAFDLEQVRTITFTVCFRIGDRVEPQLWSAVRFPPLTGKRTRKYWVYRTVLDAKPVPSAITVLNQTRSAFTPSRTRSNALCKGRSSVDCCTGVVIFLPCKTEALKGLGLMNETAARPHKGRAGGIVNADTGFIGRNVIYKFNYDAPCTRIIIVVIITNTR